MCNFISAVIAAFIAPIISATEAFELGDRLSVALPKRRRLPDGSPLSFAGEEWPNRERHLALRAADHLVASKEAYQAWAAIQRAEFFGRFEEHQLLSAAVYKEYQDDLESLKMEAEWDALDRLEGFLAFWIEADAFLKEEDEAELRLEADDAAFELSQRIALNERWESLWYREAVGIDRRKAKQQAKDKVRSRSLRAARKAAEPEFPEAVEAFELETEEEILGRAKDIFIGARAEMMAFDRRGLGNNAQALYSKIKGDLLA